MPQASTKAPAAAPARAPTPLARQVIVAGRVGAPDIPVPLTGSEVDALRERVSELAGQRSSVNSQRANLSRELRTARPGPDAAGLEAHISALDSRLIHIESDIEDIGKALSAAPNGLSETTTSTGTAVRYGPFNSGQMTAISILSILFVVAPLAIGVMRIMLRRSARPPAPQIPKDVSDRLQRMDQGIEAIALEVERIGEGQRFVTQLMNDRAQRAALPEGVPRA